MVGAFLALETIKSATELLFPTAAGAMSFNATGFTLALIQRKLDEINKKIDTLIDLHHMSSKDILTTAFICLQHQDYEGAYQGFKETLLEAIKAFNCSQSDLKVDVFSYFHYYIKSQSPFNNLK